MEKLHFVFVPNIHQPVDNGLDEPILAALPSDDRIARVTDLSDRLERQWGGRPQGLWLPERRSETG